MLRNKVGKYVLILLASVSTMAHAKIYMCREDGQVTYTSMPKKNCVEAQLPQIGKYSNTPKVTAVKKISEPNPKPRLAANRKPNQATAKAMPVVNIIPKGSDQSRRAILQQELNNERQALSQAQQKLSQGRAMKGGDYAQYQAQARQLEGEVLDRQQNIQALQRELGRM